MLANIRTDVSSAVFLSSLVLPAAPVLQGSFVLVVEVEVEVAAVRSPSLGGDESFTSPELLVEAQLETGNLLNEASRIKDSLAPFGCSAQADILQSNRSDLRLRRTTWWRPFSGEGLLKLRCGDLRDF